ncbi:dna repair and recombination protein rhm52 [Ophiostoma piceae UAMH 11346]|uniref:RAD52 homolog n=1 Tax=Ophiostoma piceae (strain UAMH 11346) TaxID=1262450 RepID=S3C3W7_OPHP1|nr:dna repair and recombination protein rhm52 [Ophiostoma piceae UAMH 11346]
MYPTDTMPAPGDQHQPIANPFQQQPIPKSRAPFGGDKQTPMMNQQVSTTSNTSSSSLTGSGMPIQHVSEYTAVEIATLQSRLERQLGPEYLSSRSGPSGQRVHYVAAEKVIGLANEVFGFNGWSSSIQNIQIDFVDENPQTYRISVGLSVIMRVTLRDGTYHEDIGYGHIENCKGKAAAFEKAKKEGTTDALKRALRNFGNVLGNCIYDKTYVDRVSKMKAVPTNKRAFNEQNLHRHADYIVKTENQPDGTGAANNAAPSMARPPPPQPAAGRPAPPAAANIKSEVSPTDASAIPMEMFDDEFLGDFDEADFCVSEEGHPDEVAIPEPTTTTSAISAPSLPPPRPNQPSRNTSPVRQLPPHLADGARPPPPRPPQTPGSMNGRPNGGNIGGQQFSKPQAPVQNKPDNSSAADVGTGTPWLSARAVSKANDGDDISAVAQSGQLFNHKAETPSIPRTPGVDHNTSARISRQAALQKATRGAGAPATPVPGRAGSPSPAPTGGLGGPATRSGLNHPIGPGGEPARRIGAPPSTSSPLANRGQFRPPPMKRGPPNEAPAGVARPPLADVPSNVSVGNAAMAAGADGIDAKRQKLG